MEVRKLVWGTIIGGALATAGQLEGIVDRTVSAQEAKDSEKNASDKWNHVLNYEGSISLVSVVADGKEVYDKQAQGVPIISGEPGKTVNMKVRAIVRNPHGDKAAFPVIWSFGEDQYGSFAMVEGEKTKTAEGGREYVAEFKFTTQNSNDGKQRLLWVAAGPFADVEIGKERVRGREYLRAMHPWTDGLHNGERPVFGDGNDISNWGAAHAALARTRGYVVATERDAKGREGTTCVAAQPMEVLVKYEPPKVH